MKEFVTKFRKNFEAKLKEKTGWGRNEVLAAFDMACVETCIETLDKNQSNDSEDRQSKE